MSNFVSFFKRSKELGGYRDDGRNTPLGYLACNIAADYFKYAGLDAEDVGDTVIYKDNEQGLCLDTLELFKAYIKDKEQRLLKFTNTSDLSKAFKSLWSSRELSFSEDNPQNDSFRYLMTDERKTQLFGVFNEWSDDKDEEDIGFMNSLLDSVKLIMTNVDFETENLYYAID